MSVQALDEWAKPVTVEVPCVLCFFEYRYIHLIWVQGLAEAMEPHDLQERERHRAHRRVRPRRYFIKFPLLMILRQPLELPLDPESAASARCDRRRLLRGSQAV